MNAAPPQPHLKQQRKLWTAVIVSFVVIIGAWIGLLAATHPSSKGGSRGFFAELGDELKHFLANTKLPSNDSANSGDTQQLENLRGEVFPQFQNLNR